MAILYERGGRGRPCRLGRAARPPGDGGAADAGLRDSSFLPHLRLQGRRPPQGRPLPDGSLAEQAVRYGTARSAHDGGYTVMARPVVWKGKLAKVVVIAVPDADRAVLGPRVIASDVPARRRRPLAATAGPQ